MTSYLELQHNYTEPKDYEVSQSLRRSGICVMSPHGGGIEPGISELVRAIAGDDFSWYLFEGRLQKGNWALHIESHVFREPRCVAFVESHQIVLAIHGQDDEISQTTYPGGRNIKARELIGDHLRNAKFNVSCETPHEIIGEDSNNICNRCRSGQGIQLEITAAQRRQFFRGDYRTGAGREHKTPLFERYVAAVRAAICELPSESGFAG